MNDGTDSTPRALEVWLDGQFVPVEEAKVSAFDAGFQHAVGLFETMTARHGRVFRATAHMERLLDSARSLLLLESLLHFRPQPLLPQPVFQALSSLLVQQALR